VLGIAWTIQSSRIIERDDRVGMACVSAEVSAVVDSHQQDIQCIRGGEQSYLESSRSEAEKPWGGAAAEFRQLRPRSILIHTK
jgi:hypothetical protein